MILRYSLFFISLLVLFWAFSGYVFYLFFKTFFKKCETVDVNLKVYPTICIIIPCYNEETIIEAKIENLVNLDYPDDRLNIWFLDGGSTDSTKRILKDISQTIKNIRLFECPVSGKIGQINCFLPNIHEDLVVNTDMDALMAPDCLKRIVYEFQTEEDVAVVGAYVSPLDKYKLESTYWATQNDLRLMENLLSTSSIVIAPCYAYRKEFFKGFPDDCIADDIYISFYANTHGYKVKYLSDAKVVETRVPSKFKEFWEHKLRKSNAYIKEILRFVYLLPNMERQFKIIYITKFFQVLLLPWALMFFSGILISMLLSGKETFIIGIACIGFLIFSLAASGLLMKIHRKKFYHEKRSKKYLWLIFILSNIILILSAFKYPFVKQDSRYKKVSG